MILLEKFLRCADTYAAAKHLKESTLSTYMLNDGKKLALLRSGGDITSRQLEKAMHWLSNNWPEDTPWPEGIERPAPMKGEGDV